MAVWVQVPLAVQKENTIVFSFMCSLFIFIVEWISWSIVDMDIFERLLKYHKRGCILFGTPL